MSALSKPTIQEVARRAGTSPSTVSRVLNGSAIVSDERKAAVLSVVAELDYRPNMLGRALRTRSTRTIGLITTDIINPFYSSVAKGVEDVALEAGFTVML